MLYLCKLISTFYHNYLERLITSFPPIDSVPSIVRPTIKPKTEALSKQKQNKPAKVVVLANALKKPKLSVFYLVFGPILIAGKNIFTVT